MEAVSMAEKQQIMVQSFLEVASGQSIETAKQFLQATSWKLEEAIQLFFVGNDGGGLAPSSSNPPENSATLHGKRSRGMDEDILSESMDGTEEVRAPLPVKRDILYDEAHLYRASRMGFAPSDPGSMVAFRNFSEEMEQPGVWEAEQRAASSSDTSRDNLASLYRPPFALMYQGPFEMAKQVASDKDKWLLVNLQSTKEFSSHMLNRDTWANEAVAQTISTYFIFWQVYDDSTEGRKVCTYYSLNSVPAVLVIDPITGQKMRSWSGMIDPERLLEDLLPFMDSGPKNNHVVLPRKRRRETSPITEHKVQDETTEDEEVVLGLTASMEGTEDPVRITNNIESQTDDTNNNEVVTEETQTCSEKMPVYPPLPEEPKVDRSLICRVGVRLPDGRRLQRNFLRTDPIQLLWSFCKSQLEETETRRFRLTQAIPGATTCLDFESKVTFMESGLANSLVSVTLE